mmetsp:Transcript_33322/g.99223  ORF Transcript_33322/g.99223 Transcript_33322/m.99223 type:complete len:247 (-) Transcript_33322:75-815(-)
MLSAVAASACTSGSMSGCRSLTSAPTPPCARKHRRASRSSAIRPAAMAMLATIAVGNNGLSRRAANSGAPTNDSARATPGRVLSMASVDDAISITVKDPAASYSFGSAMRSISCTANAAQCSAAISCSVVSPVASASCTFLRNLLSSVMYTPMLSSCGRAAQLPLGSLCSETMRVLRCCSSCSAAALADRSSAAILERMLLSSAMRRAVSCAKYSALAGGGAYTDMARLAGHRRLAVKLPPFSRNA